MKKLISLCILLTLTVTVFCQQSNCSAYPEPVFVKQPNGTQISLYIIGNNAFHYYQTMDGYTVLQNPNHQGAYEYAQLNNENAIVASGIAVGESFNKTAIVKGLKPSTLQLQAAYAKLTKNKPSQDLKKAGGENIFPSKGKRKLLVVLIQFPDEQAIYPKDNFERLMSEEGYNDNGCTGSFRDFYLANSKGELDLDVTVLGWYTAAQNKVNYGRKNLDGSDNDNGNVNVQQLVGQCIDSAEAEGIDFSDYDNDGDGQMDGLVIFHSGYGAEEGKNGYIWSHRWSLWGGSDRFYDGTNITDYCINPAKRDLGVGLTQVRVGVVCHEFGHVLGLPDLYDTRIPSEDDPRQQSEGAGNWCLMSGGPWMNQERTPCQMNAWCKMEMGWLNPTVISDLANYTLLPSVDSNMAYQVNTPSTNEYFLLENRQQKSWDSFLPGKGLAIWHIDENRANSYKLFGSNDVNTDTAAFGVGIKQADGLRELERNINRGNAGDLFPGTTNNTSFTDLTSPNSKLNETDFNGMRKSSNVNIVNITQQLDSTVTFRLGGFANANFNPSVIVGCAPLTVSFVNTSVFGSTYEWDFGNGTSSQLTSPMVSYNTAGKYAVSLILFNAQNLPADTFTTTITVNPSPVASYTVNRENNQVLFTNTSVDAKYFAWRFSNNTSSFAKDPAFPFTVPLSFYMVAYNGQCTDTVFGNLWNTGSTELLGNNIGLRVFPNPVEAKTTLTFDLLQSENVTITTYNLLGETITTENVTMLKAGENQYVLNTNVLASGIYFVKVTAGNQSGLQRIIKQ